MDQDIGYGFPKTARLLESSHFQSVFRYTKYRFKQENCFLVLVSIRRHSTQQARLGLIVAKRQVRKAHDRNLFKRMIRESFRQHRRFIGAVDVVVLVKNGVLETSSDILRQHLQSVWVKLAKKMAVKDRVAVKKKAECIQ